MSTSRLYCKPEMLKLSLADVYAKLMQAVRDGNREAAHGLQMILAPDPPQASARPLPCSVSVTGRLRI
jgi:hypothetical protein